MFISFAAIDFLTAVYSILYIRQAIKHIKKLAVNVLDAKNGSQYALIVTFVTFKATKVI